uniref:Uncharacterized protein n=1 Tax=Glyptapanteles indiensis TaxID=92994 RepID=B7S924_GLYIN|nr:hypothetical protein GIP_L8_0130 [Glyptapanteles indiensis]
MTSPERQKTCLKRTRIKIEELSLQDTDGSPDVKKERRELDDTHESCNEEPNYDDDEDLSGYESDCSEIVAASNHSRRKISLSKWDRVGSADSFFKRRLNPSRSPTFTNYSSSTSSLSSSSSSNSGFVESKPEAMETEPTHELYNQ